MPDHSMPHYPFREALDYARKVQQCVYIAAPLECAEDVDRTIGGLIALVERLYAARAGEEYEVLEADVAYGPYKHLGSVTTTIVELNDYTYKPGDRVFVTKGEAG